MYNTLYIAQSGSNKPRKGCKGYSTETREGVLCRFFSHKKCVCLRYYSLLHRPLYIRFFTSFLILCIPDLRWLTLMMIVYHHLHNISQIYMLHYVHLKMQSDSRKARGTAAEKGMRRVTAERPVAWSQNIASPPLAAEADTRLSSLVEILKYRATFFFQPGERTIHISQQNFSDQK